MNDRDAGNIEPADLRWLVDARNQIQSLMLTLVERWDGLDMNTRQAAVGAGFSLWRAVFLIRDYQPASNLFATEGEPFDLRASRDPRVDAAAKKFLQKVVQANAITFADEVERRDWSAGYYINNALYRLGDLRGRPASFDHSSLRDAWNESFIALQAYVDGTRP